MSCTSLVVEHDVEFFRIEITDSVRSATGPRTAMKHHDRFALRFSAKLIKKFMEIGDTEISCPVRLYLGPEIRGLDRTFPGGLGAGTACGEMQYQSMVLQTTSVFLNFKSDLIEIVDRTDDFHSYAKGIDKLRKCLKLMHRHIEFIKNQNIVFLY